jgi:dolichyl-phosphate-mannose-protein mannosyltransferase
MSLKEWFRHFTARAICLIIIPITIYMLSFKAHFMILNRSGPGDAQMSSLFQANLIGSELLNNPLNVAYGSLVTIKNQGYGGGLLHSHVQTYPAGSKQQQVTCYHHKDANNDWYVMKAHGVSVNESIVFVKNGDVLRFVHKETKKNLHSHNIAAPVTKIENEVSGYGGEEWKDPNDFWVIEFSDENLQSLTTSFRLKHNRTGCYLRSGTVTLPEWGFKQLEVSCNKYGANDASTRWNVETHRNDKRKKIKIV